MTDADIYAELTGLFRQVFRNDSIALNPASTSETIAGWDSFKFVEVIIALETRHGIEFDAVELDELETVGDLVRVISRRTAPTAN